MTRHAVVLALIAVVAGCAGTRPVTVGGEPTSSDTVKQAANRIYNAETAYALAFEALLVARDPGGPLHGPDFDATWGAIADASAQIKAAILEAKEALLKYQVLASVDNATALGKTLAWMDYIQRRLLAFTEDD